MENVRRKFRGLIATDEDLHRMLFHLVAYAMNVSFRDHVTVVQQDDPVRHHVNFMKDVARDDQVQTFCRQLAKQRNRLRPNHGIQTIQWFIKNEHQGLVCDRLRQSDSLAHAFAIGGYLSIGGID